MKPNRSRSTALRFLPLAVLLALGCLGMYLSLAAPVPEGKPTAYPAWWFEREAITRTDPAKATKRLSLSPMSLSPKNFR